MRAILRKILQVLDGTPAVYGKRQAGQSMVELALVTPLLIILLAGLIEIGWFANNYLSILDVTRSGARRATVLVDQQSPIADAWLEEFTYVPWSSLSDVGDILYRTPYTATESALADPDSLRQRYRWDEATSATGACNTSYVDRLFFNEVLCTMITSLDPLVLDADNDIDDVIISGFAIENVDAEAHPVWLPAYPGRPINADIPQMVVVGRYPSEANECDVAEIAPGNYQVSPRESRDPFDFNDNGYWDDDIDTVIIDGNNDFEEHGEDTDFDIPPAVATDIGNAEKQVGFSLFGNHRIPGTLCTGSEWTMRDVEDLVNMPNYAIADTEARRLMPGQGISLVEMYWEHEMLLKIPVLSPVFSAVGNAEGKMVIYVWAAFPLPSVEPYIVFPE